MTSFHSDSSCLILGEDHLSVQCAEILLLYHQPIIAFISSFIPARNWASQKKIPYFNTIEDFLKSGLHNQPFGYLYSIVYNQILLPDILRMPLKLAINYHDSLLPKYAGCHATSWAILNGEKKHGISWHIMTPRVDAGDILVQDEVSIDEKETTFSLNLKCHQQALKAFEKLISLLQANTITKKPQDLHQRTYFGRYHPLPYHGIVQWDIDGEWIDRLCRALNFDHNKNRLGSAKVILNEEFYIISGHQLEPSSQFDLPGTVTQINEQFLQIATRSQDFRITSLQNRFGEWITFKELMEKHSHLQKGFVMDSLSEPMYQQISQKMKDIVKEEDFWVEQWMRAVPLVIPFTASSSEFHLSRIKNGCFLVESPAWSSIIQKYHTQADKWVIILSALLAYFFRLNHCEFFSIAFSPFEADQLNSSLFSQWLPFHVHFNEEHTFLSLLTVVKQYCKKLIRHKTFQNDLFFRYPELPHSIFPVRVTITDSKNSFSLKKDQLNWVIDSNQPHQLFLYYSEGNLNLAQHVIHYLENFLLSLEKKSDWKIKEHALLSESEYQKIVVNWNHTQKNYPKTIGIHQWFEEQVADHPDRVAVVFEEQRLTYAELNQKANQLAHYIHGVTHNGIHQYILIYQNLCLETVITLLAVLKSGNAYVPVAPSTPKIRVQEIISDCQPALILTQACWGDELSVHKVKTVCVDSEWSLIANEKKDNLAPIHTKNAYVMYTSGSTGKPKGIVIGCHSLANFLMAMREELDFTDKEVLLSITPIFFDISGLEIYLPLVTGGRLILADQSIRLKPHEIAETLLLHQVTIMQATPATWQMLVNIGWKNDIGMKMLCGGEGLSTPLALQLYTKNAQLWNLYGPTETTIWSTCYKVDKIDTQKPLVSIGKPIANTQVYVLDKNGQPLPPGMPGILHISGEGVAMGYLNRPDLTTRLFTSNPFHQDPLLMYNTGDLVKWLEDGNLEFIERIDHQIKLRGYRVELGEIQACLLEFPGVTQALVVPKTLETGEIKLIAYLTWSGEVPLDRKKLVQHLRNRLYDHMIPAYFVTLDPFPINANGKIDKKSLPLPTNRDWYCAQKFVLPQNEEEKLLAEIWSEVLSIPVKEISIQDHFFELGGYSLLAAQVVTRISSQCFIKLDMRDLFENPTIYLLAKVVRMARPTEFTPPLLAHVKESQPHPLSFNQTRLWFLSQFHGHSAVYNITTAWKLTGDLNVSLLNLAIADLIKRQGVFRTIFLSHQGKGQQILQSKDSIHYDIEVQELTQASSIDIDSHIRKFAAESFPLNCSTLFRFQLLKLSEKNYSLLICLHHLIADGWSFGILYRELSLFYLSHYHRKPVALPALPVQYIDFCVWQNKADHFSLYQSQKEYWKKQLSHLVPLELPTDFVRPPTQTYRGSSHLFQNPF